jgi:hypothetical protein
MLFSACALATGAIAQVKTQYVDPFFSDSNYVMKLRRDEIDHGIRRTCITVRLDGTLRLERISFSFGDGQSVSKITEGKLSDSELQQLTSLLQTPELVAAHHNIDMKGGWLNQGDFVQLRIARPGKAQELGYSTKYVRMPGSYSPKVEADREGEKILKPLMFWVRNNVEKRKLQTVKDALPECQLNVGRK